MILFLTINLLNNEDNTGLPEYYRRVLPLLKERGLPICVFDLTYPASGTSEVKEGCYAGIPVVRCDMATDHGSLGHEERLKECISSAIRRFDPSAIIYPDYMFFPHLDIVLLKSRCVKRIFFCHLLYRGVANAYMSSNVPLQFEINPWVEAARLERQAIASADEIWANSEYSASEIRRYYGDIANAEIKAAPLGVDKDEWCYCPQNKNFNVAYYGRLDPQKGLHSILLDIDDNTSFYKESPLQIAGRGAMEGEILKRNYFDKTIQYHGNLSRPQVREFLRPIKWLVFPSVYEPWGQVVSEAMAMGKLCVVQAGMSGMTEQVKDGINGFHFDFNCASFSQFIRQIDSSQIDLDKVSVNARESAHDIKNHVDIVEQYLVNHLFDGAKRRLSSWKI